MKGGGEVREWEEGCRGRSRVESTPLAGMIELGSYFVVSPPEKELYRAALEVKAAWQKFRVHMHLAMHFPCGSDVSAATPLYAGPKLCHKRRISSYHIWVHESIPLFFGHTDSTSWFYTSPDPYLRGFG